MGRGGGDESREAREEERKMKRRQLAFKGEEGSKDRCIFREGGGGDGGLSGA